MLHWDDDMSLQCVNCNERKGEHHYTGMCPLYARLPGGETDYDDLIGFGGGGFQER